MPTAYGTLTMKAVPRLYDALNIWAASNSFTIGTSNYVWLGIQIRPMAIWRGSIPNGYSAQSSSDMVGLLKYPDNGRIYGITEQNGVRDGLVKVMLFYVPSMTLIGWTRSDANGNFAFGYQSYPMPLALDTTDTGNYAALAFDPTKTYNLTGFDGLSAVT